jgi:hypothetical protein
LIVDQVRGGTAVLARPAEKVGPLADPARDRRERHPVVAVPAVACCSKRSHWRDRPEQHLSAGTAAVKCCSIDHRGVLAASGTPVQAHQR